MRNGVGNCSSTTGSRRQSRKKTILKHFLKGFLKGTLLAPKLRKSWENLLTNRYPQQPQLQLFQCDLQPQIQETHRTTHTGTTTGCRTQSRNRLNSKRSKPHPPHKRGTCHRRLKPLYTEKYKVSCSGFLPKRKPMQHSCSHYNAFFQCDLQPQIQETHRTTHTGTTTGCRTQRRNRLNSKRSKPHPPHTRGTFHRRLKPLYTEKCKVSCSGFLPKRKPMQHSCSHYNAFYSMTWLTRMHLRTWQHQMTTIMQPFHCDLQPQIQETHRTTHTGTTTRCRTQRRNRLNSKRSKPHPPHTRGTFHRRLTQLYTEKYKVSCSGFLPKRKPMQHSCSHYNAFYSMTWLIRMHLRTWQHQMTTIVQPFQCDCNYRFKKRIELRTQEQPLVAEHRGGTDWTRNDPNRTCRTHEVPFIAGWSHFTRKNTRFRAPASSPKESPCNIHAAITMRFTAWRG